MKDYTERNYTEEQLHASSDSQAVLWALEALRRVTLRTVWECQQEISAMSKLTTKSITNRSGSTTMEKAPLEGLNETKSA
jgi:hypothetical protein